MRLHSTEFVLNGFNHKFQDIPTTDPNIRKVQIFRISNNQKIITTEDAGTVDINAGLVSITSFNPSSVVGDNAYITITATPASSDLAPKRNQLLQIDLLETLVTPQIDQIATGSVIAGIGYTTTPNST